MTDPIDRQAWDMRVPPWVLLFGPVVVGLLLMLWSLCDFSVYGQFTEGEPGTITSVTLMTVVFILALGAIRYSTDSVHRQLAILLSVIGGAAICDETMGFHEEIGHWVQDTFTSLPAKVTNYTDDVLILSAALVGGLLLLYWVMKLNNRRELYPYAACVVALAVGHGLLDIANHKDYLLSAIFPSLTKATLYEVIERLGCLEEWFKVWTEWFVVLLMLRLFYDQKPALGWPLLAFAGSLVGTLTVWALPDNAQTMSCLVIGGELEIVRNYHLFLILSWCWLGWTVAIWRLKLGASWHRFAIGLPLLGMIGQALVALDGSSEWMHATIWQIDASLVPQIHFIGERVSLVLFWSMIIIPGVVAGWLAAWGLKRFAVILGWLWLLLGGLLVARSGPALGLVSVTATCGLLLALGSGWLLVKDWKRSLPFGLMLLVALAGAPPLWLFGAMGLVLLRIMLIADDDAAAAIDHIAPVLMMAQLVVLLIVLAMNPPRLLPNHEFEVYDKDPMWVLEESVHEVSE